jgi:NTE family protein
MTSDEGPGRGSAGDAGSRRAAVVLAGAGARGAYEAGVLSVVLPRLAAEDVRPALYIGTSAGAINAALLAAHAHRPVDEQVEAVLDVWRTLDVGDVIRPVVTTAPWTALRWAGQLLRVPGVRLTSLLDTAPLQATARRIADWTQLRTNLDQGVAELAVVATEADGDRTVVFVDRARDDLPAPDDVRGVDYRRVRVDVDHVLASAAIPALFPAVEVATNGGTGWYVDGGLRLNAPLEPALKLGADDLVVVATHPVTTPAGQPGGGPPDVDDAFVAFVDVALVDRMVEDVRTLGKINEVLLSRGGGDRRSGGPKVVPYLFLGPEHRATVGRIAARWFDERWRDPAVWFRSVFRPDLALFGWLAGGDGPRRGDLLSYLAFDGGFAEEAIAQGRRDAERSLGDGAVPWTTAAPSASTATRTAAP